jgi:hypothetical protein
MKPPLHHRRPSMRPHHFSALLLLLVSACQCGSEGRSDPPPVTENDAGMEDDAGTQADAGTGNPGGSDGGSQRVDFLIGIAAAKKALLAGATSADLDNDGYNEYRRQLDSRGRVLREQIDVDGDGLADLVWDYSGSTKTFRADTDGNGIAEVSMDVTEDTADSVIHHFMTTSDSSGDGIPDLRRSYSIDPRQDMVDVLVEEDPGQDGSFPTRTTFTTIRVQHANMTSEDTRQLAACTASQQAAIHTAFDKAVSDGLTCLLSIDRGLAYRYAKILASSSFNISCGSEGGNICAHMDKDNAAYPWFGRNELPIFIDPAGFTSACGSLESTIFHEVSHYVFDLHEIGNGTTDPQDEVYGCERTCFGMATSQTCAQCIGKKNGTPTCKQYPEERCTADVPTLCRCDQKLYPSELECNVECPSGLGCYGGECSPRGPCR